MNIFNNYLDRLSSQYSQLSKNGSIIIHFDGKIMKDLTAGKIVWIAVLASYNGTSKFLGAPKIHPSTGANLAEAVYQRLIHWKIADKVKALSFDTTNSNTGPNASSITSSFGEKNELQLSSTRVPTPCV